MMKEEKKTGWQKAEGHIIKWMVGVAGGSILIAISFYFNTNYVMGQNTATNVEQSKDIKLIKDEVVKIKTVPVINQQQIKSIKKDVDRIEKATDKMGEKIDKMMELLLTIKNQN